MVAGAHVGVGCGYASPAHLPVGAAGRRVRAAHAEIGAGISGSKVCRHGEGSPATHLLRAAALLGVLALCTPAAGCGDPEGAARDFAVRDSAGVRIVEHLGPARPDAGFAFAAEPRLRHGHRPDGYAFRSVLAGVVRPDGGAVVVDAGNREVVAVGPDGSLRGVLARSGEGPDEVRSPRSVHALAGDTILVEDDGNARFMWFAHGGWVGSVSTAGDYSLTNGLRAVGVDGVGGLLMTTSSYRSDFEVPWLEGRLVRFDLREKRTDTVGSFDLAPRRPPPGEENPYGPFGDAGVAGGGFVHTRGDRPEVAWRAADGGLRQIVRWVPEPEYPTEADFEAFLDRMAEELARVNPGMPRARLEAFVTEQRTRYRRYPDVPLPHFGRLVGADDGAVWLAEYTRRLGSMTERYVVVAADGTRLERIQAPESLRILDVRGRRVLAVVADELDVQSIVVYDLVGSPPNG